jgi:hypothetical protein
MSYRLTSAVLRGYTGPRDALPVLLALADFANDRGECWPSVAKIAARARLSVRQTRRHLTTLERAGWITSTGNRIGGRALSTRWAINPGMLDFENPDMDVPVSGNNPDMGVRVSRKTRTSATRNPDMGDRKPGHGCPPKQSRSDQEATSSAPIARKLALDADAGSWVGLSQETLTSWSQAFPHVDVPAELARAAAWVAANPTNRPRSWSRFLVGWLGRAQDKAKGAADGDVPSRGRVERESSNPTTCRAHYLAPWWRDKFGQLHYRDGHGPDEPNKATS